MHLTMATSWPVGKEDVLLLRESPRESVAARAAAPGGGGVRSSSAGEKGIPLLVDTGSEKVGSAFHVGDWTWWPWRA
jgi:hypothetical protein